MSHSPTELDLQPPALRLPLIPLPSAQDEQAARVHQQELTKPPGSLGRLEDVAIQIAAFQATQQPAARPCSALLFAADHPVTVHGVSPYPSAVTQAMMQNFNAGGAAAAVLSHIAELPLVVIDAGVFGGPVDPLCPAGDIRTSDALSEEAFASSYRRGMEAAKLHAAENAITIFGEMGIGNTTVAAAMAAALLRLPDPAEIVGAGTGATGELFRVKCEVVRDAVHRVPKDAMPFEILRRLGGREMVCIYAAMKQALSHRSLVLVDGFIVTAVAAVLVAEEPAALAGLIFAHESAEQGHSLLLQHLGATPLLQLGMRLGEASGALMAYPLVERACVLHNKMATFTSAGIPGAGS